MIASNKLFDSRGGFPGQALRRRIAEIQRLRVVAMATNFAINWLCVNDSD